MKVYVRIVMTALMAVLAISLAAGTAAALRSVSLTGGEGEVRLTGTSTFKSLGTPGEIICNVTFEKTLSTIIPKVAGTLIGKVTRVDIARPETCTHSVEIERVNGIVVLGVERPELWRIFYHSFLGELPVPTGFLFEIPINAEVRFTARGIPLGCLYSATVGILAAVDATAIIGRLIVLRNSIEPRGFGCPRGEFTATLNPERRIRITLL